MKRYDATEARKRFADILNCVVFGNETVVVTRHGRDLVAVIPADRLGPSAGEESKKPSSSSGRSGKERKHA